MAERDSTQDAENSTHLMSHKSPQHHATFIKMEAAGKNFLYLTQIVISIAIF
jgi:hypothetical protein